MAPTTTVCCVNPKEHFFVCRSKIVDAGASNAIAKKMNNDHIMSTLTAMIG
jgi:hypothetical protein